MTTPAATRYYEELALSYIRGKLDLDETELSPEELWQLAENHRLRLHPFKCDGPLLPRVRRAISALRSYHPEALLDIGSGRGAFLWPLLDAFPDLPVRVIERDERKAVEIGAVQKGGFSGLRAMVGDVRQLPFSDSSIDCVSALEVLEHLPDPQRGIAELVRVAQRAIIVSVPSRKDDNPEHLQLFTEASLTASFLEAGASRISHDYVHNHLLLFVVP
jgi:ubiquinone/menaquinone biosynthesis C-methylase UbiE